MHEMLDTSALPPADRVEAISSLVCGKVVRVELEHHVRAAEMAVTLRLGQCGDIGVCHTHATATTVRRTARQAREDAEPVVFLGLQRTGSSLVVQHGREARLQPGEFAVYDTTSPYTLLFDRGIDATFFRIPRAALALPPSVIRDVSAIAIGPGNPLAALAADYLTRLADDPRILPAGHGATLAVPTVELIRAALTVQAGADTLSRAPLAGTLAARILADIRAHLADPDLSPSEVAARQHISVRYLHRILQREGIRFGDWVRRQRLEGARSDLAGPATTIGAVARRWGFADAGRFSKTFRAAYGVAPRDWRARVTGDPEPAGLPGAVLPPYGKGRRW